MKYCNTTLEVRNELNKFKIGQEIYRDDLIYKAGKKKG